MRATQSASPLIPPESDSEHHHLSLFIWLERRPLIGWLLFHRSGLAMFLSWMAPIAFMIFGYSVFPRLRTPVTLPWNAPTEIWLGLFVQLLLVFLWMIHEVWYTTNRNTPVGRLQADVVGDMTVALGLTATCAAMAGDGGVPWWFIVPLLGALIDAYQSPVFGINNAVEKPFFPTRGST